LAKKAKSQKEASSGKYHTPPFLFFLLQHVSLVDMTNSKCLSDLSSLSVIIDDDLCAFPSLHHEGLELDFSA